VKVQLGATRGCQKVIQRAIQASITYQRQGQVEQVTVQGPVVYRCTLKNQEIRQVDDVSEKGLMMKTSEQEVGNIVINIGGYRTELHPLNF